MEETTQTAPQELKITSENEAWSLLEQLQSGDLTLDERPFTLKFEKWPYLHLKVEGDDWDSSIPSRFLMPVVEYQNIIYRVYAQLIYGTPNINRLSNEEKSALEIVLVIKPGCTDLSSALEQPLTQMIKGGIAKMNGTQIAITVILIALLVAGDISWTSYLQHEEQMKELELKQAQQHDQSIENIERMKLEKARMEEETKRLEMMKKAVENQPVLSSTQDAMQENRRQVLKTLKPEDSLTVGNYVVPGTTARDIVKKERQKSEEIRIDGVFKILNVQSGDINGFKVQVKPQDSREPLWVTIPPGHITMAQEDILKNNEWTKKPFFMAVNARMLHGKVTKATVISVSDIHDKEAT